MAYTVGSASVDIVPDFKNAQLAITAFFNKQQKELKIPVRFDTEGSGAVAVERQAREIGTKVSKAMADGAAKNQAAADRIALQMAEGAERSKLRAHAEALKINAQMDREAARQQQATMREITRTMEEQARAREQIVKEEEDFAVRSAKAVTKAVDKAIQDRAKEQIKIELDAEDAVRQGRRVGGLITRSIHHEMEQNAVLIAAALGAIIAFGAPVALGAASGLFIGIGAVAAAQSERVRSTWIGLWDEIRDNAVSDAAVLVPAFERMAGAIGQSFQRMRPLIRDAFEGVEPQIDNFTASLLRAGENALPGIVRAIQAGGPVIQGLGDLLEKIGTGTSDFFDTLAGHAPAAGQAASALGDALAEMLPAIAEILGQGAELATVVLPLLTTGFRGLNAILGVAGGILPQVATAFLAFRAVQGTSRLMEKFANTLVDAGNGSSRFSTATTRMGVGVAAVGRTLPVLGLAFAAYGAHVARSEQQTADWTQTLMKGGAEARRLSDLIREQSQNNDIGDMLGGLAGNSFGDALAEQFNVAEEAADKLYEAMTPLEKAQHDLDVATRALQKGMEDESTTAGELAGLKQDVARAAARQAAEEENLARATHGVTEAMQEQADAARARVDADFGYQKSLLDTEQALLDVQDAQAKLDELRADPEASPADIAAAELTLREAILGVADAYSEQVRQAGAVAMSNLPAAMNDQQKAILGAKAELDELNRLIASGVVLSPSMEQYRQSLLNITDQADGAMLAQAQLAAAVGELGFAVESIPDTASIEIDAPTDEVIARLRDLGFTVETLPDGSVKVTPETQEAFDNLGELAALLTGIDGQNAEPDVSLNDDAFTQAYNEAQENVDRLNNERPTPVADINDSPFAATYESIQANISRLNNERPEPDADLNDNPFSTTLNSVLGRIISLASMHPRPTTSVNDQASGPISSILNLLNSLRDRQVTITTIQRTVIQAVQNILPHSGGAIEDHLAQNPRVKYHTGGAVRYGSGGPWGDQVDAKVSPGEHVLDFGDVTAMGGQDAVYDFRAMLHSGWLGSPGPDRAIRAMLAANKGGAAPTQTAQPGAIRDVTIQTWDNPRAIIRALRADQHQQAALAPVWGP